MNSPPPTGCGDHYGFKNGNGVGHGHPQPMDKPPVTKTPMQAPNRPATRRSSAGEPSPTGNASDRPKTSNDQASQATPSAPQPTATQDQ